MQGSGARYVQGWIVQELSMGLPDTLYTTQLQINTQASVQHHPNASTALCYMYVRCVGDVLSEP